MPLVTVTVGGVVQRVVRISGGKIVRDSFNEADHPRGKGGEFTPVVGSITGEEIAPKTSDVDSLRFAARKYYDAELRGKSVKSEALGGNVVFAGSRKAFSTSADPDKLRMFAALPQLLQRGVLRSSKPPHDPNIERSTKAYHYIEGYVDTPERRHKVGVTVREDTSGLLYYNHVPNYAEERSHRNATEDTAYKAGPGRVGGGAAQASKIGITGDDINLDLWS